MENGSVGKQSPIEKMPLLRFRGSHLTEIQLYCLILKTLKQGDLKQLVELKPKVMRSVQKFVASVGGEWMHEQDKLLCNSGISL